MSNLTKSILDKLAAWSRACAIANLGELPPENEPEQPLKPIERLEVEMDAANPQKPLVRLRQQSWADGVGWFTQRSLNISPDEVPQLMRQLELAANHARMVRSQTYRETEAAPASSAASEARAPECKLLDFPSNRAVRRAENHLAFDQNGKVVPFEPHRHAR